MNAVELVAREAISIQKPRPRNDCLLTFGLLQRVKEGMVTVLQVDDVSELD